MTSVSERLKNFERANREVEEANSNASPHSPEPASSNSSPRTKRAFASSRRRNRNNGDRIDLSDDEMDMDPKRIQQQQQQEHGLQFGVTEPPPLSGNQKVLNSQFPPSSISPKNERPISSEIPRDMVDLDLIAKSLSSRKLQTEPLALTKDEIRRKAEHDDKQGKADEKEEQEAMTKEGPETRHPRWAMLARIWKNPLAEEKKRQEELMLKHLKEADSSFSEESYQIDKNTQGTFINTKKEEAETVRLEKELRQAEQDARTRKSFWEKIVQTTLAVFVNSVEAEKRQQEHVLLSHLRAMDSSVDEDEIRRQKEAQELFVEMKRRETERQRILQMEEVEKQRRDAMLAENMRLPEGLQAESSSLMMQSSLIEQGAKIQEALRSSLLFQAANFSPEQQERETPAPRPVPLHIQKQLQQALLLQQAMENPEIEIDQEALRHSQEIQESLVFYAKKNQRTSWLDSFTSKRPSVPEEVSFDDAASVGSRVSWLSGGFGGAGGSISRSWRSSISKPEEAESTPVSLNNKKDQGKNGLRNSWQLRGSNQSPKGGKDWAETNLHLAGHVEGSESANSDL